jgi:hypothetical protein
VSRRYQLSGLPPVAARNGLTAFLPHWNNYAASGAQSYKYGVHGGPVQAIPATTTDTAPGTGEILRLAQGGTAQSADAPQSWYPDHYQVLNNYGNPPGAGMPIERYNPVRPQDTTMIPVPAVSLRALLLANSAALSGRTQTGGPYQISAVARGLMNWADRTATSVTPQDASTGG